MKWQRTSDNTESSDTIPVYRVTRFRIEGKSQFRPSYAGEFLGFPVPTAKAAREICERHHSITQHHSFQSPSLGPLYGNRFRHASSASQAVSIHRLTTTLSLQSSNRHSSSNANRWPAASRVSLLGGGGNVSMFPSSPNMSGLHVGHTCQCSHLQVLMACPPAWLVLWGVASSG